MQGTTHRSSTPTSSSTGRSNSKRRVDRPSNEFAIRHYYCGFTLVYSVKHQQVAGKRSVSSVEIVLQVDLQWTKGGMKNFYSKMKAQFPEC